MRVLRILAAAVLFSAQPFLSVPAAHADTSRIKDIASLQAGRDNQLIGYGLVVGL